MKKYPKDVKVVFKNFPLSFHKQAKTAAKYALAAHKQGKWYEMYEKIMADYKKLKNDESLPETYAKDLGLDMNKFMADFKSQEVAAQVDLEMNQFRKSGISRLSVPKFLIQGKEFKGKKNIDSFSEIIDLQLKGVTK